MASIPSISLRRAVPAALAVGMLLSTMPAVTTAAQAAPSAVKAAEWRVLRHMNTVRARRGLAPLRMAGRVRIVARDRSRSMKNADYFSHVSPSGVTAGSLLASRGIQHQFWGEAIGWTRHMGLDEGARWMVDWWKRSTPHRRLMLRRDFNYAGVGVARDGSKTLWTIVFVNQLDHTPPTAGLLDAGSLLAAASGRVTVRWWGRDRPLSTRTARLDSFRLQHRRVGGSWHDVLRRTTRRQVTLDLGKGTHLFRLRARDNRGNAGGWSPPLRVLVS